jgi:hypothetical protein
MRVNARTLHKILFIVFHKTADLAPIELALQVTDYKTVGAYRKFSGNNGWSPNEDKVAGRTVYRGRMGQTRCPELGRLTQLPHQRAKRQEQKT